MRFQLAWQWGRRAPRLGAGSAQGRIGLQGVDIGEIGPSLGLEQQRRAQQLVEGMDDAEFMANDMAADAVERCLQRITEAARKLDSQYDAQYPELALHNLRQFGSVLRHDYDVIAAGSLWTFIQETLPDLLRMAENEIARLDGEGGP